MSVQEETTQRSSVGIASGLLTSCLVTILGSIAGHEPQTILFRALVGGLFVGGVTATLSNLVAALVREQDDDEF